jgi:hypothetical protein
VLESDGVLSVDVELEVVLLGESVLAAGVEVASSEAVAPSLASLVLVLLMVGDEVAVEISGRVDQV